MSQVHHVNEPKAVAAAAIMSAASVAVFLLTPIIIGRGMETRGWSPEQASQLPTSYFLGYLLVCLSGVFWLRRLDWRLIGLLGYGGLVAGLLMAGTAQSLTAVSALFALAGIGAGTLYSLSTCAVADTDNADRNFGIKIVAEQLLGASLMLSLPLISGTGFATMLLNLALVLLLLGASLRWLPPAGKPYQPLFKVGAGEAGHGGLVMAAALLALLVFFGGLSGYWAFIERVADAQALSAADIGQALALGIIGGGVGGFGAALIGNRWGELGPTLLSALVLAMVLWTLSKPFGFWTFTACAFALSGFWNFSLAYQLGSSASLDPGGRFTPLISAALAAGAMLGPMAAGSLLSAQVPGTSFDATPAAWLAMAGVVLSLGIFSFLLRSKAH